MPRQNIQHLFLSRINRVSTVHKMKYAATVLAVLAIASSLNAYKLPATGSGELAKELQDFFDLIPIKETVDLVKAYMVKDEEFRNTMRILQSNELKAFMMDVEAAPELAEVLYYMQKAGLDVYYLTGYFNQAIENIIDDLPPTDNVRPIIGGLKGFADDFAKLVDYEKAQALLSEKMAVGGAFAEYVALCTSKRFLTFYFNAPMNLHFQIMLRQGEDFNINNYVFEQLFPMLVVIRAGLASYSGECINCFSGLEL